MRIIKTDSLGVEMLNFASMEETKKTIKKFKTKEEAIFQKDLEKIILFEVIENKKIEAYFTIEIIDYKKWLKDYKLEGVEI
ncbi:MAG: hypothetical protein TYPL_0460 [Candidatus Tyloplasma litorale]|nr:MAG: hypothetical protein TYPL_0460 [Mycoplasmatales bacterium]